MTCTLTRHSKSSLKCLLVLYSLSWSSSGTICTNNIEEPEWLPCRLILEEKKSNNGILVSLRWKSKCSGWVQYSLFDWATRASMHHCHSFSLLFVDGLGSGHPTSCKFLMPCTWMTTIKMICWQQKQWQTQMFSSWSCTTTKMCHLLIYLFYIGEYNSIIQAILSVRLILFYWW